MGCACAVCTKILQILLQIIQAALCITIILIVALHLDDINWVWEDNGSSVPIYNGCLMGEDYNAQDLCSYAYAVTGLSLLIGLCLSIFLCITCNLCGVGSWISFGVAGFLCVWWVIAGIVFGNAAKTANDSDLPQENWRNAVVVLTWAAAVVYGIISLIYLVEGIQALRSCCGKCCCASDPEKGDKEEDKKKEEKEKEAKKEKEKAEKKHWWSKKEDKYKAGQADAATTAPAQVEMAPAGPAVKANAA